MSALNYRVKKDVSSMVINTIYAIFLGLLFTFFFDQDIESGRVKAVYFLVNKDNWIPVLAMSVYFALDWLTTNLTVSIKNDMNHWLLMILILLISYLGGLVVLSFSPNLTMYCLFALYACIVPWWDLLVKAADPNSRTLRREIVTYGTILTRVVVGVFMFVWASLHAFLNNGPSETVFMGFLLAYVLLKLVRYMLYIHYDTI